MLEITDSNLNLVINDLNRETTLDTAGFHQEVANYMVFSTRAAVNAEVDVNGRRFAPLAVSTTQKRRGARIRGASHILQDTGSMLKALIPRHSASEARVLLGDRLNVQKAVWHQLGTRKMPQREWLGIREFAGHNDVEVIAEMVERYLG